MKRPTPAKSYPPGFFSEPTRLFIPGFVCSYDCDATALKVRAAQLQREVASKVATKAGTGWGANTIAMPKTPKSLPPKWMGKAKAA